MEELKCYIGKQLRLTYWWLWLHKPRPKEWLTRWWQNFKAGIGIGDMYD